MTQTFSPEDTGEIQRVDADATRNLGPYMKMFVDAPSVRRPNVAALTPPTPSDTGHLPIIVDVADRQHHLGEYRLRRSVPYVLPADRRAWTVPRHRRPSALRSVLTAAWAVIRGAL